MTMVLKANVYYAILTTKIPCQTKTIDIPIDLSLNGQDSYYFDAQTLNLNWTNLDILFLVWDNDAVNGSKSGRTQSMEYRLPSKKKS